VSELSIATWNVNSIKARLANLLDWLRDNRPDVLLLQEVKCVAEAFPHEPIAELGYHSVVFGQKSYNGVAILSRHPLKEVRRGLPGEAEDRQARYIEATTAGLRVASIYLPNGNPVDSDKFAYKIRWLERLRAHAARLLEDDDPVVLGGDYNVIPEERDCWDPAAWAEDALFRPESRRGFRALLYLGYYDAFRARHPETGNAYTYWDYQGGAFQLDRGIRIDHILLSPPAVDRLVDAVIDSEPRGRPKASDHTPLVVTLERPPVTP